MGHDTFSIFKERFTEDDIKRMDERIIRFLDGWRIEELYKGKKVYIPGTWDSEVYPYKYFQVIKSASDPNAGEDENEIQCYLSAGWRGYDDEVIIILGIYGKEVLSGTDNVKVEILKPAGASLKVYFKDKLVTDFKVWPFGQTGKSTVGNLSRFLKSC